MEPTHAQAIIQDMLDHCTDNMGEGVVCLDPAVVAAVCVQALRLDKAVRERLPEIHTKTSKLWDEATSQVDTY